MLRKNAANLSISYLLVIGLNSNRILEAEPGRLKSPIVISVAHTYANCYQCIKSHLLGGICQSKIRQKCLGLFGGAYCSIKHTLLLLGLRPRH